MTHPLVNDALLNASIKKLNESKHSKCPACGCTKYGLMPTDFETAKCSECGKTWQLDEGKKKKKEEIVLNPELNNQGPGTGGQPAPDLAGNTRLQNT